MSKSGIIAVRLFRTSKEILLTYVCMTSERRSKGQKEKAINLFDVERIIRLLLIIF